MDKLQFIAWRQAQGMTQTEAARVLDMSLRQVQYYEADRAIPRVVELACKQIEAICQQGQKT